MEGGGGRAGFGGCLGTILSFWRVCVCVFVLEGGGGREGRTTLLGNIRDLVRSL